MHVVEALILFEETCVLFLFLQLVVQEIPEELLQFCFLSVNWLPPLWNTVKSASKQARHYSMQNKTQISLSLIENICLLIYLTFFFPPPRSQRNLRLQLKVQVCSICMVVRVWGNIKFQQQCMTTEENSEVGLYFLVVQPPIVAG